MRNYLLILITGTLATILFSAVLWSKFEVEADNPHLELLSRDNCLKCHDVDDKGRVAGSEFVAAMIEICYECHKPVKLGRSHAVDVDLDRTFRFPEMIVPEILYVGGQWDDLLTCATCHYIHGPWKSEVKAYKLQKPIPHLDSPSAMFSTLFLRIPGNPDGGWETLCNACHAESI